MAHGQVQYYPQTEQNTQQTQQPYYGNTTEAAAPPYQAPAYQPNGNQGYYGAHQGYYGQNNGIELQQPSNTYQPQRETGAYAAPEGPPPNKRERDLVR